MMALRIPVALSPHHAKGKPCGYYLIAMRLFQKDVTLCKQQFCGYSDGLVVTVGGIEHLGWDSVLKMAVNLPMLGTKAVNWLAAVPQYKSPSGFRTYIGSKVLMPTSADEPATHTYGEFEQVSVGNTGLWFLRLPLVNGDILMGRKKLYSIDKGGK